MINWNSSVNRYCPRKVCLHIHFTVNNMCLILQSVYTCMVCSVYQRIAYSDALSIVIDRQGGGEGSPTEGECISPTQLAHVFLVWSWILDSLFSTCEYLKLHASRETLSIACTHLLCVVGRYWCHSRNKTGQVWLAECLFKLGWWDLPVWFKDTGCWGFHITSIIMKQSEVTTGRCWWCRSWKV